MSSSSRKFQQRTQQESAQEQQTTSEQQHTAREFGSVEEMLQHDSTHVVVPPHVAARIRESVAREPRPARGWWQRLFGR